MLTESISAAPSIIVADNPEIADLALDGREVTIVWRSGGTDRFNLFWLRDNCPGPETGDKWTAVRRFSLAQIDETLTARRLSVDAAGRLAVEWSIGGAVSIYEPAWLKAMSPGRRRAASSVEACTLWDASWADWPAVDFGAVEAGMTGHADLLEAVARYGFALVDNVPATPEGTERLAAKVGYIRENDFGRVFDIVSEPEVWDLSQSDSALDPHTDDPYRYNPPGISFLHCLEASGEGGGASILVDGFKVCAALKQADPAAYRLLAETPVEFVRRRLDPVPQGADVHLVARAPVIALDAEGRQIGFRFHERSMGCLAVDPDRMDALYRALIKLTKLVTDPAFAKRRQLAPGQALVFDNQRVMHGRTGFEGMPGRRWMRITQTDRDQFHSRLRLLRARLGRPGVDAPLPAGAFFG